MTEHKDQSTAHPHLNDWMKKIQDASGYVDGKTPEHHKVKEEEVVSLSNRWAIVSAIVIFILALIPRLFFIYFVSDPDNPGAGWFGDAYHHWQIAYLTQEIGMSQGFLRLWDLKGMEYFWGLLHPLLTMITFSITGSVTVGVERALTAFFGSVSTGILVLLVNRHWNLKAAVAAGLFAALNPVGVFNDGTGMVEPLGIPFLLLGVYFWPSRPLFAGLSLVIALMARGEYWVFSLALVAAMVIFTKKVHIDKKILLLLGFVGLLLIYMKYLITYTGNPIYPFYENYVANIYGTWQLKPVLTAEDIQAKYLFLCIFIASVAASLLVLWKRPRGTYLYLLGLGNWLFLGATFGLGQYIKSYASYVWYVRFMILPYIFIGLILAVFLFSYIPKTRFLKVFDTLKFNWLVFIAILAATQLVWIPIWTKYSTTIKNWNDSEKLAAGIAKQYKGGGLLLFEGNPELTYALVRNHNVEGKNIVGQMFDPYFYFTTDPYEDWEDKREIVLKWLKDNNIRTIATYTQSVRYSKLAEVESDFFSAGKPVPNSNIIIYSVTDAFYETDI